MKIIRIGRFAIICTSEISCRLFADNYLNISKHYIIDVTPQTLISSPAFLG